MNDSYLHEMKHILETQPMLLGDKEEKLTEHQLCNPKVNAKTVFEIVHIFALWLVCQNNKNIVSIFFT